MMQPSELAEAIRAALVSVVREPEKQPSADDGLRTILINDQWAQPHAWIDIFEDGRLRNEWRLCHKGEVLLEENPPTLDELTSYS